MSRRRRQRGFTLIELMIAMLIGLFLLGGLLTLVAGMRTTFGMQGGLAQLQDSERLAMTLLADVIQTAGYYPTPTVNTAVTALPVSGVYTTAGQSLYGTDGAAPGDSITVRYLTAGNDGVIDCTGNTYTVATTLVNTFQLTALGTTPQTYALTCSLNGATAVQLISGVTNLQILYGVKTNTTSSGDSIDSYLTATQVTAGGYWPSVNSVLLTLTFTNPLYGTAQGQTTSVNVPQTLSFTRVIGVMAKIGVAT
jgi:type IV pilus assembly protein PilW